MDIISVKNVTYSYASLEDKTTKNALDDISFGIEKGSYTAIIGTNGSGKSTVCRLICGLLELQKGVIEVEPENRIGLVFQSPKDQIVSGKVYRDTAFGPQNLKLKPSEVELRTIECLSTVELLEKAESPSNALSLGQTQKLALSGMLAVWPQILILDEAVTMLDPESRECIFEFLRNWHKKGNTIIHITHDLEAICEADSIIGLENGKVFFEGATADFIRDEKLVQKITGEKLTCADRTGFETGIKLEKTVAFSDIDFSYSDSAAISNINFDLYKGTLTALTGPSGAGKSTILELGAGLLRPESGVIHSKEKPALVQQNASAALFEAFAADDVAFGPRNAGIKGKKLKEVVKTSMDKAGLPFELFGERQSAGLSGGEQRRLAIAGILAMNRDIVFFDEPTAGLDGPSRNKVMTMLRGLAAEGKTVLFTTHKRDEADFADREIRIENGRIATDTFSGKESSDDSEIELLKPYDSVSILSGLQKASSSLSGSGWKSKSVIEKLAPVLRIFLFLFLFVLSLAARNIYFCSVMLLISVLYCLLARFSLKKLLINYLKVFPFLMIFFIFQIVFRRPVSGEVLYTTWKWFTVSPSKLLFGFASMLRTYSAISCICAFFITTPEYDLIDGIKKIIPSRSFILIMEVIFRFIPLLIDEASVIIKTQIIRGGLGKAEGTFSKIKGIVPLAVPMIIRTVKRAELLAEAIVMRGFNEKRV